jgi:methionine-gamma-lyase
MTSTFVFKTAEEGKAFFELAYGLRKGAPGEEIGLIYSRLNNPDLEILEDRLTLWDEAEAAAVFESGMAAISTTLLTFLKPGDVILFSEPVYGGTDFLLKHILPRFGIRPIGVLAHGRDRRLRASCCRTAPSADHLAMIFLETPANPTNALVDIAACAAGAALSQPQTSGLVAVDNTFLGPLWQHPLQHGADLVIYSATKYIGGHSDVIAGVCLGEQEPGQPGQGLAHDPGHDGKPDDWLDADAQPGNAQTAHDLADEERPLRGRLSWPTTPRWSASTI